MGRPLAWLIFAVGLLAAIPLLLVLYLIPPTSTSLTGLLYLLGCLLGVGAMISAPWRRRGPLLLGLLGAALLLVTITLRLVFPPPGTWLNLVTLPGGSGPRWQNRLFDEQDIVLFGARLAPHIGFVSAAESRGLLQQLAHNYDQMQGVTPLSPSPMTFLGLEQPAAFDALIAQPPMDAQPKAGIVFLHGYGGSFTLQCWLIARAGDRVGAMTICPSTGPAGDWWSPAGRTILRESLSYLRQRGIERIYLAGLSNGGIGASRLAAGLEPKLAGLILISGADPSAPITKLPVLVVQGKSDERIPATIAEQYVAKAGSAGTYLLLDGDHFVLLKQADAVQAAIADWITRQEALPVH